MPVYNAGRFLAEAIESVLSQSFTEFEFIIVDDGSDDDSLSIIRSYKDERIKLLQNPHDFIGTLNKGMAHAAGKYIARMDADDIMEPDRLEVQYRIMESHPEVTLCSTWMTLFGEGRTDSVFSGYSGIIEYPLIQMLKGNVLAHPTVVMRRSFLVENNLQYEYYDHAEDYKLWFEMVKCGAMLYTVPQPLLRYRFSDTQVTATKRIEQQITANRIRSEIIDYLLTCNTDIYPELSVLAETVKQVRQKNLTVSVVDFARFIYTVFINNTKKLNLQ